MVVFSLATLRFLQLLHDLVDAEAGRLLPRRQNRSSDNEFEDRRRKQHNSATTMKFGPAIQFLVIRQYHAGTSWPLRMLRHDGGEMRTKLGAKGRRASASVDLHHRLDGLHARSLARYQLQSARKHFYPLPEGRNSHARTGLTAQSTQSNLGVLRFGRPRLSSRRYQPKRGRDA